MFRVPGKEGTPAEKEAEKRKQTDARNKQVFTFLGIVVLLKTVPYLIDQFS